jgi:hypothetical protein
VGLHIEVEEITLFCNSAYDNMVVCKAVECFDAAIVVGDLDESTHGACDHSASREIEAPVTIMSSYTSIVIPFAFYLRKVGKANIHCKLVEEYASRTRDAKTRPL